MKLPIKNLKAFSDHSTSFTVKLCSLSFKERVFRQVFATVRIGRPWIERAKPSALAVGEFKHFMLSSGSFHFEPKCLQLQLEIV